MKKNKRLMKHNKRVAWICLGLVALFMLMVSMPFLLAAL